MTRSSLQLGASSVLKVAKRWLKGSAGNMTMMAGISAVPIFIGIGAAVDAARITHEQTMFHAAVDSAVLAIAADDRSATDSLSGSALADRMELLKGMAENFIVTNYESSDAALGEIDAELTITGSTIRLSASLEFPTSIMSLVGVNSLDYTALSEVKKAMRPIELVMVMDTTGSMDTDNKLEGAQDAAHSLLETLYGGSLAAQPRSEYIRTALVPFSGAVKLDTAAYDFDLSWIDTTGANTYSKLNFNAITAPAAWNNYYAWSRVKKSSSVYHTWNGCVEARRNGTGSSAYNVNDAAPSLTTPDTLFPAYFQPDVSGSTVTSNSYGYSWIGGTSLTAVGSECRGLTNSSPTYQCTASSDTYRRQRQENYYKYEGFVAGTESANPSSTLSSYYGPWGGCAVSKMVPMTYDRAKVEAGIDAMRSHGITVIPEGLAWGWRAISPTEPLTKVEGSGSIAASTLAPYGDVKWQKIMVLMTDGDNNVNGGSYGYNNSRYSAYGYGAEAVANNRFGTTSSSGLDDALNTYTETLCENVKDAGITLYVASFGDDISESTKDMLEDCATSPDHYQHASTTTALATFFDHIGQDVINKSIYVSK